MNDDERVGIEGIAFSPTVINKAEAAAILRIVNTDMCPNCGEPLLVARYGTCRKCGVRTDLDVTTGQIGQRDQGDEREE